MRRKELFQKQQQQQQKKDSGQELTKLQNYKNTNNLF